MSEIVKNKKFTVERDVICGYRCDICGKEKKLDSSWDERELGEEEILNQFGWATVKSSHQGWGNGSIESFETVYVCSVECFAKILDSLIKKLQPYEQDDAEINGMNLKFARKLLLKISDSQIMI